VSNERPKRMAPQSGRNLGSYSVRIGNDGSISREESAPSRGKAGDSVRATVLGVKVRTEGRTHSETSGPSSFRRGLDEASGRIHRSHESGGSLGEALDDEEDTGQHEVAFALICRASVARVRQAADSLVREMVDCND